VLARRSGKAWYLGAMTSERARTEKVPLRFLPPGRCARRSGRTARSCARSVAARAA
ncbi:hypothetical protein FUT87_27200, partial [Mitsuaria sp. TWR114]